MKKRKEYCPWCGSQMSIHSLGEYFCRKESCQLRVTFTDANRTPGYVRLDSPTKLLKYYVEFSDNTDCMYEMTNKDKDQIITTCRKDAIIVNLPYFPLPESKDKLWKKIQTYLTFQ